MDDGLRRAKERAWREVDAIDAAHARGDIDDDGWHRAMAALVVPAYLAASTPNGGSGHSGSPEDWEWSRGVIAEALQRDGTFLDVGCANGLMMESVARWGAARGLRIEPHGLDIAPELIDVARRRLPSWAHRIAAGNALGFVPARRHDIVRTGLEYVPATRRRELVSWLLDEVVAPGGRLIIGKYNEEKGVPATELALSRWGFLAAGRAERPHPSEPRIAYRATWIDAPRQEHGDLRFRALRREDLPHLVRWLAEPHVEAWWHERLDLAGVHAKYLPRIEGREPCPVFVIERQGNAVGWIQWYRWADYPEHASRLGAAPTDAGIDLAIGERDQLGQGVGSRAIRAFVDDLVFADPAITACVSDPEQANRRSVRAFENAGFTIERTVVLAGEATSRCIVRRARPDSGARRSTCLTDPLVESSPPRTRPSPRADRA